MNTPLKTARQIVLEAAAFYTSKNRSFDADGCLYVGPKGTRCAFSRCCHNNGMDRLKAVEGSPVPIEYESLLLPEYQGQNRSFWETLQSLHDSADCWDDEGLTREGFELLLCQFKFNPPITMKEITSEKARATQ